MLKNTGRGVIHLSATHRVGRQRQDENGGIGRIDLPIRRIARKSYRQVPPRRIDRRLHIAGGAVDVAAQIKLQDDAGGAEGARRGHFGHARDAPKLAFQRGCDRGRHGFRARAWQCGRDLDRGKVHGRQSRHREEPKGDRADERHGDGQQCSADRPPDEGG